MAVTKLTKVEIQFTTGVWTDITTDYRPSWVYKGELNNTPDIATVRVVNTIRDTYTLKQWLPIRIYEGWTTSTDRLVFKGVITRITDQKPYITIDCADEIYKLLKAKRVSVYNKNTDPQAGVLSAIAEDLMDEVITTDVENSGTLLTVDQFIISNKTNVLERVSTLASALDWIILYDPEDDKAYFVSRGYWTNLNVLTIETDTTPVKWDEDATRLYNDLTFIGGTTSAEGVEETFNGDGAETTFTTDKTPSDTVIVSVGGTKQTRGTPDVTPESDYDYSINKANKQIIFNATSIPAVGVGNVSITISSQIPPIIHLENASSIADYNIGTDSDGNLVGIKEVIVKEDISSNDDALVYAQNLLAVASVPFLSTTAQLTATSDKYNNYKLGELIPVTDSSYGITERDFLITEIERQYPGTGAKLTLGDKAYRLGQIETNLQDRISRLENQLSGDYDILADFRSATAEMTLFAKHITVTKYTIVPDVFRWDHPDYGNWDENDWAADSGDEGTPTVIDDEDYE